MEIEEEFNDKPYQKDFTNYFPVYITFVNDHKKLLNFGTLQNMMSTEGSPTQSPPDYDPFSYMKVEEPDCTNLFSQ